MVDYTYWCDQFQVYGGFGLFNKWPMMSVHFWGENPVGNWTLTVVNRSPDAEDSAELFDWTLKFYGTSKDPQPGVGLLKYRQVCSLRIRTFFGGLMTSSEAKKGKEGQLIVRICCT